MIRVAEWMSAAVALCGGYAYARVKRRPATGESASSIASASALAFSASSLAEALRRHRRLILLLGQPGGGLRRRRLVDASSLLPAA